ncbi:MmgE/PrpD family protein [Streptomyces sp. RFCAC02]|uniref:MmgE/PrpD family protein n=1 Tax=Streptomyces sp. RFCAC02 TaxID=2499143 RepID=UPI00101F3DF9|nr:MmgE/PrpD family protein [Streptomyces sp. RFCAC02]
MSTPLGRLAHLIVSHGGSPLPDDVREAARRTLYNVLATTVGAAREPATDVVAATAAGFGAGDTPSPGRTERLKPLDAALLTGTAAHLDDYDDTHLSTVIHPGAVGLGALVGLAGLSEKAGDADADEVLAAFAWGVEAQLRLGVAISPEHYDAGWHITGTCGAVGAAVTAGLLLNLGAEDLRVALEWAVEGGLGNREGFGSMTKPFHPGKAAVNGLRAAWDVAAGSGGTGPGDSLTGPDGLVGRLARGKFDPEALLSDVGRRWELLHNTFKPYPCGIVTHPAIEAAEALHAELAGRGGPDAVRAIRLVCHPLVPELTGNVQPVDGLQARFSTAHGVAAGLLRPRVDLAAYSDAFVVSEPARRLRALVDFAPTEECGRDAAGITVTLADGGVLTHEVTHARGSLARPLTDEELKTKARGLVDRVRAGGADALDAATRREGPGFLRGLLAAAEPDAVAGAGADGAPSEVPAMDGAGEEHALADLLADVATLPAGHRNAEAVRGLLAEGVRLRRDVVADDERERAGAVAEKLVLSGYRPAVAAAVAPCTAEDLSGPDAARAVAVALAVTSRLAARLEVGVDRLPGFAAGLAAIAARRPAPHTALMAIGLAGTQTTGVAGPAAARSVDARRARLAAADAVTTTALAEGGFTGPARPLTGRRGLLSLLARRAEPLLTGADPLDDPALDTLLGAPRAGETL